MRNNIRLGNLFGIEVGLDYSWFIIFLLTVWSLDINLIGKVNHFLTRIFAPL